MTLDSLSSPLATIAPAEIADALLSSTGWARAGLTAPNERVRTQAALELAQSILDVLDGTSRCDDSRQLGLFW
jgi:hypothetical protein